MPTLSWISSVAIAVLCLCGCSNALQEKLNSSQKELLQISHEQRNRLVERLGLTNTTGGYVYRDSKGERLFFSLRVGTASGDRKELLVVVTSKGAHTKPWRVANEKATDDEDIAIWQDSKDYAYIVRSGERLPVGYHPADVSGDWVVFTGPGRKPWLARLESPTNSIVEFPASHLSIQVYSKDNVVHVFSRPGWRNVEGPMEYFCYDLNKDRTNVIKHLTLPWARITIDMDPDSGLAVINDNNRFWGRTWLFDVNTGVRKSIRYPDWLYFVNKDVGKKWRDLTKP